MVTIAVAGASVGVPALVLSLGGVDSRLAWHIGVLSQNGLCLQLVLVLATLAEIDVFLHEVEVIL